jgi:Holliday junction resolvasome RuvABC endonuclease subunit
VLLALDLGTKCGFAVGRHAAGEPKVLVSGVADFSLDRFAGGGMRFLKFTQWLNRIYDFTQFERVAYEGVRGHKGVTAAHIYGGLMATLTGWCEEKGLPYEGVPVGTIKKFIAGKGNAGKSDVIEAVRALGYEPKDDNEADAVAIFLTVINTA